MCLSASNPTPRDATKPRPNNAQFWGVQATYPSKSPPIVHTSISVKLAKIAITIASTTFGIVSKPFTVKTRQFKTHARTPPQHPPPFS
jgi:hypothetical protein